MYIQQKGMPHLEGIPFLSIFTNSFQFSLKSLLILKREECAIPSSGERNSYCSAFGRTVTASGHSNRFAMGRMLPSCTFSHGLRSRCADLANIPLLFVPFHGAGDRMKCSMNFWRKTFRRVFYETFSLIYG